MIAQQYPKEQVAEFALDAESAAEYETTKDTNIQELLNKAPGTLTPYEEQLLIDAGFDDYVKGGMKGILWVTSSLWDYLLLPQKQSSHCS